MTRSFVGLTLSAALLAVPALASAQGNPRVKASQTQKETTISLQAGRLRVVQTLTPNTVALHVTEGGDTVRFSGDLAGHVTIQRGAKRQAIEVRKATATDQAAVLAMLSGSPALRSFDAVMETTWGRSAKPAAPFRSARALLALFRGNYAPTVAVVAAMASPKVSLVRRDGGPSDCWDPYAHDVVQYTYDLEACVDEAQDSWLPWALGWCAYEYDIKASLAFVWLMNCYSIL